jgi:methylphosphotriester-DNA--protein-cysteine methyltransferase
MIRHSDITDAELRKLIRSGKIQFGGNQRLKIFGKLSCSSGKNMKRKNRIFFESMQETASLSFRPCGHCMKKEYEAWKNV